MARVAQADWAAGNASWGDSRSRPTRERRAVGRNPVRGAVVRGRGNADRRERRRRDRARYHCICPPAEWWPSHDGAGVDSVSSRRDLCACRAIPFAHLLPVLLLGPCSPATLRRPWDPLYVAARALIRLSHLQW